MSAVAGADIEVRSLDAAAARAAIGELAGVLIDCVERGASVSFMSPLTQQKADAFWAQVADGVARGERRLLVASLAGRVVGTVQLIFAEAENQPHRADVAKLLVHGEARGRKLGEALMRGIEAEARAAGRTVLVLDTASIAAERIYLRLGWSRLGVVPDYALLPDGRFCDTTLFFKRLTAAPASRPPR